MTNFTVVYDANVLYPAPLRDLLMRLAAAGLFRARWSNQIHNEWMRNLIKNRPELKPEQLERTRQLMDSHCHNCLVDGYEELVPGIKLPDEDDRHVVAAAIKCGADAIITFNLKDFPASEISKYGIEVIHPDDFIVQNFDLDAAKVLGAVSKQRKALKSPPLDADTFLDTLLALQLPETVRLLSRYKLAI